MHLPNAKSCARPSASPAPHHLSQCGGVLCNGVLENTSLGAIHKSRMVPSPQRPVHGKFTCPCHRPGEPPSPRPSVTSTKICSIAIGCARWLRREPLREINERSPSVNTRHCVSQLGAKAVRLTSIQASTSSISISSAESSRSGLACMPKGYEATIDTDQFQISRSTICEMACEIDKHRRAWHVEGACV